ncbi:MAG: hypothetical protein IJU31_06515 [Synergistaceae bacterium]|nr:hypothetical protein [Synergistaceae bacterium]
MRFFAALIKYFVYLCLILIVAGVALFWFDTGSWLVLPLAKRAGNFFLAPMQLEIENVAGSVRNGFAVDGVRLLSGDEALFTLDHVAASPDWDLALSGMDGLPFIKSLKVRGVSSDLDKVMTIANHFATSKDAEPEEKTPLKISLNPFDLSVEDVNFATPYSNLALKALTLDKAGNLSLASTITSRDNVFPFKTNALISLNPIEIISSDLVIGNSGKGNLNAALEPLKADFHFANLSLDEILKFAPPMDIKASGRLDGKVSAEADGDNIKASGVVSMPRANVMDIPLNFRLPFAWDGKNFFSLTDAALNTNAAKLNLSASADISSMRVLAKGSAKNISLTEIGAMFAPDLKLRGESGNVDFDVDTVASGDILSNTRADINANIPSISAMNMKIVDSLAAKLKLNRKDAPKIDLSGRMFGGKLFARGEAAQDSQGNIKPQAVVSVVNLDVPTLLATFPQAAKAVKKPSGKITARTIISDNLNINTTLTSEKLSANGFTLSNIKAVADYDVNEAKADLESFSANLGKGLITASGAADIKTGVFSAVARTENLEPKVIPELKKVMGALNVKAEASGNFNDLNTIKAIADISAKNLGYDGMKVGNIDAPLSYANNLLDISNARATIPGGVVTLKGNVNLKNTANPAVDVLVSTQGINLAETLKAMKLENKSVPVTGKVMGAVSAKGTAKNLSFNANIRAENIKAKAGTLVDMPRAVIEAKGDMKKITVSKIDAKINQADIKGNGLFTINQKNFNDSKIALYANVKHFNIKPVLIAAIGTAPITGVVDAVAKVNGTIAKPEADLKITRPLYYGTMEIEDIAVKLNSPSANHFKINAGAKIENFKPEADIEVKESGGIWSYRVDTKPLDINSAIETQMPGMSGMAKGFANVSVTGSTKANSNININATAKEIKIMDKISVKNISLPVVFSQAKNKIEMKKGVAYVSGGEVNSGLDVDLTKKNFTGKVKVSDLDFGKLASAFLEEGEVVGKANAEVTMKGGFGVMPTSFANGKFSTTPGYIHKMAIINKVSPTKKIGFENISGSFFWDGKDIFLNPGTGATAGRDEPLYRYVHVNGSMGIPGKGLNLMCEGRFDLKILDQLLGAMKGVFQYMTGGLAQGNFLKDAAGRMLGIKRRDYQSISFTLANSWQALRLLNLKITKPLEDFLPLDMLNKDQEKQRDDTQFKLNLKFPVGQGDTSVEEESTGDQFKQQLIDNLFNIGL